jgi:hypothetical protein
MGRSQIKDIMDVMEMMSQSRMMDWYQYWGRIREKLRLDGDDISVSCKLFVNALLTAKPLAEFETPFYEVVRNIRSL